MTIKTVRMRGLKYRIRSRCLIPNNVIKVIRKIHTRNVAKADETISIPVDVVRRSISLIQVFIQLSYWEF
jgi:hypothetical protein